MAELRPLTDREIREIMIVETKNELGKTKLLLRIAERQHLIATNDKMIEQTLMGLRSKVRAFERSLVDLEDIHKQELAAEEKKGENTGADKGT